MIRKMVLAVFAGFFLLALATSLSADENPNVVIMFLDDSGWGDFHPFGDPKYPTQNQVELESSRLVPIQKHGADLVVTLTANRPHVRFATCREKEFAFHVRSHHLRVVEARTRMEVPRQPDVSEIRSQAIGLVDTPQRHGERAVFHSEAVDLGKELATQE